MKKLILSLALAELAFNAVNAQQFPWTVYGKSGSELPSKTVTSVAVESSGQVWIGTDAGLAQMVNVGGRFTIYKVTDSSVADSRIYCIVSYDRNGCWIGTDRGLVTFDGEHWKSYNSSNSRLPSDLVYSVAFDAEGNKWIGTYNGLVRFGDGGWTVFDTKNSGLPGDKVYAVAVDHYGSVWLGTDKGLARLSGTSWTVYNSDNSSLPDNTVCAEVIDRLNSVWVATPGHGLACLRGTRWTVYNSANSGLINDRVYSIALDPDGTKWFGTAGGLSQLSEKGWTNYDRASSPMPGERVHAVCVDNEGTVWMGTDSALVVLSRQSPANLDLKRFIIDRQNDRALESLNTLFKSKKLNELGYTNDFVRSFSDLLEQGKTDAALSIVSRVEGLDIRYPLQTYIELGDLFEAMGNAQETVRILGKVLQVDPQNETAKSKLAEAYYGAGRYDEVIGYFRGATDKLGSRYLALSYEKKSMLPEANEAWGVIARASHDTESVQEAQDHIRQNTISMMSPDYKAPEPVVSRRAGAGQTTQAASSDLTERRAVTYPPVDSVDINTPHRAEQNRNGVALILALSDYQNSSIPEVKYARQDGEAMRKYLVNVLGFKPENILPQNPEEELTYGRIQTYIRSILPSYLKPDGSSDLFVYFTGHGAPSTATHEAYLVPWDGDPNYVNDNNSYSMKKFYVDLELLNARHKIIVVDACFSGFAGNGASLMKYASPALLKVNNPLIADPRTVIFQSSSPDQVSNWYDAKGHGMFTYFFLKGLQGAADLNGDGTITAGEMIKYIDNPDDGLPYYSNRLYLRPQNAQMEGDDNMVIGKVTR